MEYIENLFINNDHDDNIELSSETPIGWSSMCFDQTINYYIECNSINACQEENTEKSN